MQAKMCRHFGTIILEKLQKGDRVMTPTIQAFQQKLPDTELDAIIGDHKGEHKKAIIQHIRKHPAKRDKDGVFQKPTGEYLGTLVAFMDNGELYFGYAMFNRKREPISMAKREGARIAIARTLENRNRGKYLMQTDRTPQEPKSIKAFGYSGGNKVPFRVQEQAPLFIARAMKYFKVPFANMTFGPQHLDIQRDATNG